MIHGITICIRGLLSHLNIKQNLQWCSLLQEVFCQVNINLKLTTCCKKDFGRIKKPEIFFVSNSFWFAFLFCGSFSPFLLKVQEKIITATLKYASFSCASLSYVKTFRILLSNRDKELGLVVLVLSVDWSFCQFGKWKASIGQKSLSFAFSLEMLLLLLSYFFENFSWLAQELMLWWAIGIRSSINFAIM